MSKKQDRTDLSQKVMEQIREKKVEMRPRIYFLAGSLLLGVGLAGAVILAILFINIAFFKLRVHGPFGYLWFGRFGLKPFMATFPWLPLVVAIGGVLGGIVLLKKYDISYKKSFLGLVIGLVALILTTGLLLDLSGVNERVGRFKQLKPLYRQQFMGDDWVTGEIVEVKDKGITLTTPLGEEVDVIWSKDTLLPFGSDFSEGERVRVVGEWQGEVFSAKGIGKGGMWWRGQMLEMQNGGQVRGIKNFKAPKHLR